MKDRLFILTLFFAVSLLLPMISGGSFGRAETGAAPAPALPDSFAVLISETGELRETTPREYLVGCLAAQIPLDYEQEALKAQAAAAYTYALRISSAADPSGALLSDDSRVCQPYFTPEKCAEIYGEDYEKYLPKLEKAADYGVSHPITRNGEAIWAVYHSVSAGRTNSAYGIWGKDFPYLAPADSFADRNYINFECSNEMTAEQARMLLAQAEGDIRVPVDPAKWFTELNANEDGYVISVKIGENLFSGGDIWRIFGIRSTAFSVSYRDGIFTFVTWGYGHGAGLSQYGANELARNGKTAEEILRHYYGEEVSF